MRINALAGLAARRFYFLRCWLIRLLAAIAECAPETDFTTGELVRHARFAEPLKELLNGMPPKKIGRLFKRIEGQDFNGLRVERIGSDSAGVIWRVYGDGTRNSLTL